MAFHDSPIVDKNAERSEESVLLARKFLSKKNGFISREVASDDYGVDINCELIIDGNVTHSIFPIQIKSAAKAQYIFKNAEKQYTLSFLTSRLGYLTRSQAFFASMIIYYDESLNILFFDFVTDILNRLLFEKKDDSWMNQRTVQISFPESKIINNTSIKELHEKIRKRFELVQDSFKNIDFDFVHLKSRVIVQENNRIHEIIENLKKFGSYLFNTRKYHELIYLLEQLPKKYIDSPPMAYLAALVYTESSQVLSADYFLKICIKNLSSFSEDRREAILMQKFKNDFQLGIATYDELLEQLDELEQKVKSEDNRISIELNRNQVEINKIFSTKQNDKELEKKTYDFYQRLLNLDISEEQKHFNIIFQTENLVHTVIGNFSQYLLNRNLYLDSHQKFIEENELRFERLNSVIEEIFRNLDYAFEYASKADNELMKAHYYYQVANTSFILNLNYYIFDYDFEKFELIKVTLAAIYSNYLKAFEIFKLLEINHQAFLSASNALETYNLSKYWINFELVEKKQLAILKNEIQNYSDEVYFKRYNPIVEKIAKDKLQNHTSELDENGKKLLVQKAIEMYNLPEDRSDNIMNELEALEYFRKNCTNGDLVMLTNQVNPNLGQNRYKNPSKYAIMSKSTGIFYAEGYNIKEMLHKLGF